MKDQHFPDLDPSETELAGRWLEMADRPTADPVEQRIRWLITHRLAALGTASDGWDWLFRDPRDGRLWELTFPTGSIHGSGPRRLAVMTPEAAAVKYGGDVVG